MINGRLFIALNCVKKKKNKTIIAKIKKLNTSRVWLNYKNSASIRNYSLHGLIILGFSTY